MDIAFLDIEMGTMSGLELAAGIKRVNGDTKIIFVTGYGHYAVDAFALHATGYLMKPISEADIKRELTFAYGEREEPHIRVQMFGGFEVFVDGKPVSFGRSRAKEFLAYLLDLRGASVTTSRAYMEIFDSDVKTVSDGAYFRNIVRDLKKSLSDAGIGHILRREFNSLAVNPEGIDCDYFRFLEGELVVVNSYHGDYLPQYSWAEPRNAELGFRKY